MNPLASILVPLDGSSIAARALGCATWLASRLEARLHILSATSRGLPARQELERLRVPEAYWPFIELHQASACSGDAILAAIARYNPRLVIMTARGAAVEEATGQPAELSKLIGHVTQTVIERSAVPVLLLPPGYREALPWEHVLVPVSGGAESDEALVLAVRLANALGLSVHVVHVTDADSKDGEFAMRVRYSDVIHHEYRAQLEELVARALPTLTSDECRCIQSAALGHGDVARELIQLMQRERISALVAGWNGQFGTGRARLLKHLISVLETPVLLVKSAGPSTFQLKVGEELV